VYVAMREKGGGGGMLLMKCVVLVEKSFFFILLYNIVSHEHYLNDFTRIKWFIILITLTMTVCL